MAWQAGETIGGRIRMNLNLNFMKHRLSILIIAVFTFTLITGNAFANFKLFKLIAQTSEQKDLAKNQEQRARSAGVGDQDKEQKKREKEEKKRAEKALKAKNKTDAEDQEVASRSESKSANSGRHIMPAATAAAPSGSMETVNATVETDPVPSGGDASDDPAIWINPADPAKSTIIGTNKQGGLAVYDLNGKQIQYLPDGMMDNVDIRDGFTLGGQKVAIVTASNRKDNSMAIYKVNSQTRMLEPAAARTIKHGIAIYGMCMYRSAMSGKTY